MTRPSFNSTCLFPYPYPNPFPYLSSCSSLSVFYPSSSSSSIQASSLHLVPSPVLTLSASPRHSLFRPPHLHPSSLYPYYNFIHCRLILVPDSNIFPTPKFWLEVAVISSSTSFCNYTDKTYDGSNGSKIRSTVLHPRNW